MGVKLGAENLHIELVQLKRCVVGCHKELGKI